jgi:NADH:ubiquinone oxidoreductase subunit H
MRLGWKIFLPFSLFWVMFMALVLLLTNSLPNPQ